jgi:hypothetical protein
MEIMDYSYQKHGITAFVHWRCVFYRCNRCLGAAALAGSQGKARRISPSLIKNKDEGKDSL